MHTIIYGMILICSRWSQLMHVFWCSSEEFCRWYATWLPFLKALTSNLQSREELFWCTIKSWEFGPHTKCTTHWNNNVKTITNFSVLDCHPRLTIAILGNLAVSHSPCSTSSQLGLWMVYTQVGCSCFSGCFLPPGNSACSPGEGQE